MANPPQRFGERENRAYALSLSVPPSGGNEEEGGATPTPYPSPNTLLAEAYGKTTGRRGFDPYLSDWSDSIKDDRGRVRLLNARCAFLGGSFSFEDLKRAYKLWVDLPEFSKIEVWSNITNDLIYTLVGLCPKRGNDIYRWKLKNRLGFLERLEDLDFFNPRDHEVRGGKTKMLFVTLTWDPSMCDLETAWSGRKVEKIVGGDPYNPKRKSRIKCLGKHYWAHEKGCPCVSCAWNRWVTGMRKRYGHIKVFRDFEAFGEKPQDGGVHADGYPHVHAVLYSENHEFTVSHRDRDKHFRILRAEKDEIANLWPFHVDIEACYSVGGAMGYIKKYLLKTYGKPAVENVHRIDRDKSLLTVSLLWLFRKQSFAVSGGWGLDLITHGGIQTDFDDFGDLRFVWVGIFTAKELGIDPNMWSISIPNDKGPPDNVNGLPLNTMNTPYGYGVIG